MTYAAACADNPYHNSAHAADVTSRLGALLFTSGVAYSLMKDPQGKIMLLASIVAAIIHDFEHPGAAANLRAALPNSSRRRQNAAMPFISPCPH